MHELSIVASLYEILEEKVNEQKAKSITKVKLQVGVLSGVVPEFLESAFEIFKKDTLASEASLEIVKVPLKIKCRNCQSETTSDKMAFLCPECGSHNIEILSGKELILETLELSF
jgi:hydrogenase nickel incorporation protein HypA/HybF